MKHHITYYLIAIAVIFSFLLIPEKSEILPKTSNKVAEKQGQGIQEYKDKTATDLEFWLNVSNKFHGFSGLYIDKLIGNRQIRKSTNELIEQGINHNISNNHSNTLIEYLGKNSGLNQLQSICSDQTCITFVQTNSNSEDSNICNNGAPVHQNCKRIYASLYSESGESLAAYTYTVSSTLIKQELETSNYELTFKRLEGKLAQQFWYTHFNSEEAFKDWNDIKANMANSNLLQGNYNRPTTAEYIRCKEDICIVKISNGLVVKEYEEINGDKSYSTLTIPKQPLSCYLQPLKASEIISVGYYDTIYVCIKPYLHSNDSLILWKETNNEPTPNNCIANDSLYQEREIICNSDYLATETSIVESIPSSDDLIIIGNFIINENNKINSSDSYNLDETIAQFFDDLNSGIRSYNFRNLPEYTFHSKIGYNFPLYSDRKLFMNLTRSELLSLKTEGISNKNSLSVKEHLIGLGVSLNQISVYCSTSQCIVKLIDPTNTNLKLLCQLDYTQCKTLNDYGYIEGESSIYIFRLNTASGIKLDQSSPTEISIIPSEELLEVELTSYFNNYIDYIIENSIPIKANPLKRKDSTCNKDYCSLTIENGVYIKKKGENITPKLKLNIPDCQFVRDQNYTSSGYYPAMFECATGLGEERKWPI